jgi:hypothetical protein
MVGGRSGNGFGGRRERGSRLGSPVGRDSWGGVGGVGRSETGEGRGRGIVGRRRGVGRRGSKGRKRRREDSVLGLLVVEIVPTCELGLLTSGVVPLSLRSSLLLAVSSAELSHLPLVPSEQDVVLLEQLLMLKLLLLLSRQWRADSPQLA